MERKYRYVGGTSPIIPQVLEWQAIDNRTTLESTLIKVKASKNLPNCRHCGIAPDDLKSDERLYMAQAAATCLEKIQALPKFAF
jgi:hypothetical protein